MRHMHPWRQGHTRTRRPVASSPATWRLRARSRRSCVPTDVAQRFKPATTSATVEQGWDWFAEFETFQPTDEFIPAEVFRGGNNLPPQPEPDFPIIVTSVRSPDATIATACTTMPPVMVHGVRPASHGFNTMMVFRNADFRSASGGGISRRIKTGVKQTQTLSCQSDEIDRQIDALQKLNGIQARGYYLFRYAGGGRQVWSVTSPFASDKGLMAVTPCVVGQ